MPTYRATVHKTVHLWVCQKRDLEHNNSLKALSLLEHSVMLLLMSQMCLLNKEEVGNHQRV